MEKTIENLSFYQGKKVLVTGHTGFKGTWLRRILTLAGAKVTGFALNPLLQNPVCLPFLEWKRKWTAWIGDVRDLASLQDVFERVQPSIVFHLAAQPIVRDSYKDPVYTYETNVMGTVHMLECIRQNPCVKSFVNVTTDKVYENREWEYGYRECDPAGWLRSLFQQQILFGTGDSQLPEVIFRREKDWRDSSRPVPAM